MTQLTRAMSSPSKMRKIQSSPTRRIRNFWQRDAHTEDENMRSRVNLKLYNYSSKTLRMFYIVGGHRSVNERYGLIKKKKEKNKPPSVSMTSSSSTSSVSFRDKTKLGRCYKFQYYTWICNFELGQLKEASHGLIFFLSTDAAKVWNSLKHPEPVPGEAQNVLLTQLPDPYFIKSWNEAVKIPIIWKIHSLLVARDAIWSGWHQKKKKSQITTSNKNLTASTPQQLHPTHRKSPHKKHRNQPNQSATTIQTT